MAIGRYTKYCLVSASLLCVTTLSVGEAMAQGQAAPKSDEVVIEEAGSHTLVRGRLLELAADTVTVMVAGEQRKFALDSVLLIRKRGDSLKNGALVGAVIGAGWCAIVCGQALDSTTSVPLAVLVNGGLGALIGAGVDAAIPGFTTVYRRPSQGPGGAGAPALSMRWRF